MFNISVEELMEVLSQVKDKSKPVYLVPVNRDRDGMTSEIVSLLECCNALTIFTDIWSGGVDE